MGRNEIEIRFECQARMHNPAPPWAATVVIVVHGERDVEKAIAWARKQFKLDADDYLIAEVKNGRAS